LHACIILGIDIDSYQSISWRVQTSKPDRVG